MPAARDVGAPFIAPACRHTVRLGDVHELFPRAMAGGPFASSTALGDVHELFPRAMAGGPFASSTAARREKCGPGTHDEVFNPMRV